MKPQKEEQKESVDNSYLRKPERTIRKVPLTDYREARAFFERVVGRKYNEGVVADTVVTNTQNGPF